MQRFADLDKSDEYTIRYPSKTLRDPECHHDKPFTPGSRPFRPMKSSWRISRDPQQITSQKVVNRLTRHTSRPKKASSLAYNRKTRDEENGWFLNTRLQWKRNLTLHFSHSIEVILQVTSNTAMVSFPAMSR